MEVGAKRPDRWAIILAGGEGMRLPVRGVMWSDWGEPARVFGTLGRPGIRPKWADPEVAPVVAAAGSGR